MRRETSGLVVFLAATPMLVALAAHGQDTSNVSGTVRYYASQEGVPRVTVGMSGSAVMEAETDGAGDYAFAEAPLGDWRIVPRKIGETANAVSALDASFVFQVAVGMREIDAVRRTACDVTGDGSVSALDGARILQYKVGLIDRLPVAAKCGSDWAFLPESTGAANQRAVPPQTGGSCAPGEIVLEPLDATAERQDFVAVLFGDCTGNWRAETPTPTNSAAAATPTPTRTATRDETPTATSTPTRTHTPTATPTPSGTPTRTSTPSATATRTWTQPPAPTPTISRTPTRVPTVTRTVTPTRTPSFTRTTTHTWTPTFTRTPTITRTVPPTLTFTPTATPTCVNGLEWNLSAPLNVASHAGGKIWLAETVPTDSGWGVFWTRQDPQASTQARVYYAHVSFDGQVTNGPAHVLTAPRISFRERYYMPAWSQGHFGVTVADQATLYYQNMTLAGATSGRRAVGPPLFTSTIYDQEADGDLDSYADGFVGVVEGECAGHSCAYYFKLDHNGVPTTSPTNIVDFDLTHQFYPKLAYDGSGFAILSVKDIRIETGGVMTKYLPIPGATDSHIKVAPTKQYQWDEFPDVAWNGNHFAALWTENSARSHSSPWQIRFATFRRSRNSGQAIANRILDVHTEKTLHKWTTKVHAVGSDWVAQYSSRQTGGGIVARFELLDSSAQTKATLTPFALNADALGSSVHFAPGHAGTIGIARGYETGGSSEITFYTLTAPVCAD